MWNRARAGRRWSPRGRTSPFEAPTVPTGLLLSTVAAFRILAVAASAFAQGGASGAARRRACLWAIAQAGGPPERSAADCCFRRWRLQPAASQLAIRPSVLAALSGASQTGVERTCRWSKAGLFEWPSRCCWGGVCRRLIGGSGTRRRSPPVLCATRLAADSRLRRRRARSDRSHPVRLGVELQAGRHRGQQPGGGGAPPATRSDRARCRIVVPLPWGAAHRWRAGRMHWRARAQARAPASGGLGRDRAGTRSGGVA